MDLTIIYDNTAFDPRLGAGWGFSCLVACGEATVLFDTGADGDLLLSNMEKLCIRPGSVDYVFISHLHLDHVGGLASFRAVNRDAKVYFPDTAPNRAKHKMIALREQQRLLPGMYTTGILEGIEQSLLVWTSRGWVVISGCAHPGVGRILQAAAGLGDIRALIGGLHDFQKFELVRGLELICPTHCTMYDDQLRNLFPQKCIQGGAGRRLVLD
ncbi:MAG: MBL fold metallo-hydrolase [Desulfohalobiaceae bacterium]|nr:MBL fold metallo-hydrolase [Desulfohalobiaceae bacterium]